MTFGGGQHGPVGATGLEVRLGGAERRELRDSAFEIADAEVEVGVRPARAPIAGDALEAEADRAAA